VVVQYSRSTGCCRRLPLAPASQRPMPATIPSGHAAITEKCGAGECRCWHSTPCRHQALKAIAAGIRAQQSVWQVVGARPHAVPPHPSRLSLAECVPPVPCSVSRAGPQSSARAAACHSPCSRGWVHRPSPCCSAPTAAQLDALKPSGPTRHLQRVAWPGFHSPARQPTAGPGQPRQDRSPARVTSSSLMLKPSLVLICGSAWPAPTDGCLTCPRSRSGKWSR